MANQQLTHINANDVELKHKPIESYQRVEGTPEATTAYTEFNDSEVGI